jgi:hypothetical protein
MAVHLLVQVAADASKPSCWHLRAYHLLVSFPHLRADGWKFTQRRLIADKAYNHYPFPGTSSLGWCSGSPVSRVDKNRLLQLQLHIHAHPNPEDALARIIRECEEIGRQKKPPLLQTC